MTLDVDPHAKLIRFVIDLYRKSLQGQGQTQVRADMARERAKKKLILRARIGGGDGTV